MLGVVGNGALVQAAHLLSTQDGLPRVVPATFPGRQEHWMVWDRSSIWLWLQQRRMAITLQVPPPWIGRKSRDKLPRPDLREYNCFQHTPFHILLIDFYNLHNVPAPLQANCLPEFWLFDIIFPLPQYTLPAMLRALSWE